MPTLRPRRARPLRSLVLPTTLTLLLALAGCSNTAEIPRADASPSASPLFASEDEALEAATAVYAEYNATASAIFQQRGDGVERLKPLLSDQLYEEEAASIQEAVDSGITTKGTSRTTGVELQQYDSGPAGIASVAFYACSINDQVTALDESGNPSQEQPEVIEVTLEVIVSSDSDGRLFISRRDFWAEGNQCGT